MATRDLSSFDLNTQWGRSRARRAGFDVPKMKTGKPGRGFDAYVRKSDACWEWTGKLTWGYGHFQEDGRNWRAHRYAWTRANGPIPDGLVVMHRCDNRRCVRLDHLELGTQLDNRRDAVRKGRVAHSERGTTTLTTADVLEMRARHRPGASTGEWTTGWIAAKHGLHVSTIFKIVSGKHWKYVPLPEKST